MSARRREVERKRRKPLYGRIDSKMTRAQWHSVNAGVCPRCNGELARVSCIGDPDQISHCGACGIFYVHKLRGPAVIDGFKV